MSRFWAGGSSSESENDTGSDSEEEVQNQKVPGGKFMAFDSDSESEDEVRVVRSQKDKAWDSMRDSIGRMRSAMKINDWSIILDEFKVTNKLIEKAKMLIIQNGIPKFYIKMLGDLEDFLVATLRDKESIKKMKAQISKSFNTMKLTLRKHNKTYEDDIALFRANPKDYEEVEVRQAASSDDESSDSEESEEDSEEESDEEEESGDDEDESSEEEDVMKKPVAKSKSKFVAGGDSDSDDDSMFDGSESDSDSSDDDNDGELKGRAKWLKKAVDTTAADKKKAKQAAKKLSQKNAKDKDRESREMNLSTVRKAKDVQTFKVEEKMSEEALDRRVNELITSRGRKGNDAKQALFQLEVLSKIARFHGPRKEIPVLMHLISSMFDGNRNIDDYMDLRTWRNCRGCMLRIVHLLQTHSEIVLGLISTEDVTNLAISNHVQADLLKRLQEDEEEASADAKKNPNELRLVGSMENYLIRLQDEYTKSLQQINPHTQDYVIRLSDEALLLELAEGLQAYYTRVKDHRAASRVALLRVEHLYYKSDSMATEVRRAFLFNQRWGNYSDLHPACTGKIPEGVKQDPSKYHPSAYLGNPSAPNITGYSPYQDMESLCGLIFKTGDERTKTRALLCAVYYHSLHDRYYRARDLFLISCIQDTVDRTDISTQILYNRALVTLGLCAFRMGLISKAYESLGGVCSFGRAKELLSQGIMRNNDRDVEQENAERRRQIPYHMHINPDLLECCYLICAMITELPHVVKKSAERSRSYFRKNLQSYNRQVFTGPPESVKEHILAASKALIAGDLAKANGFILSMDVWNLIPNDGCQKVKTMLSIRLKEEALRVFLFSAVSTNYQSLCLSHVCSLFDMDLSTGRRIISHMIFHSELDGAWDRSPDGEDVLVLHKVEATPVQVLALQVADKMTMLVESNERTLDPLSGAYGFKDDWASRNSKWQQQEDRQGARSAAPKGWKGPNMRGGAGSSRTGGGGRGRGGAGRGGGGSWSNQPRSTGNKTFANKAQLKDPVSKKTYVAGWGNASN